MEQHVVVFCLNENIFVKTDPNQQNGENEEITKIVYLQVCVLNTNLLSPDMTSILFDLPQDKFNYTDKLKAYYNSSNSRDSISLFKKEQEDSSKLITSFFLFFLADSGRWNMLNLSIINSLGLKDVKTISSQSFYT